MLWFKRATHREQSGVGIYLGQHTLAVVLRGRENAQLTWPIRQEFATTEPEVLSASLRQFCREQHLVGQFCDIVIGNEFYKLQQTDTPKVPEAERNQALQWALRDMMDFPVNEALLQSFTLPASVQRGTDRIYAAFSHRVKIQQLISPIISAGFNIASIDIAELALANFLRQYETLPASSAILFENARGAILNLYLQDDLVLSRQLAGVNALSQWTEEELQNSDTFLLEVQRTLDFFESQIARRPVQKLFTPALSAHQAQIDAALQQNLNVTLTSLPVELNTAHGPDHSAASVLAMAATLRRETDHAAH